MLLRVFLGAIFATAIAASFVVDTAQNGLGTMGVAMLLADATCTIETYAGVTFVAKTAASVASMAHFSGVGSLFLDSKQCTTIAPH